MPKQNGNPKILAAGAAVQLLTGIPAAWGVFQKPVMAQSGFSRAFRAKISARPAADHNHARVNNVNDGCQRAGKLLAKTCHLLHGTSITTLCQGDNRRRSEQVTSHLLIAFTKTAAGNKRLHAVVFAAIATD